MSSPESRSDAPRRPAQGAPAPAASGPGAPDPGAGRPDRLQDIEEELRSWFFREVDHHLRAAGLAGELRETAVRLELRFEPGGRSNRERLRQQLETAAHRAADRFASFPAGHVYCHWCGSFTCSHSLPPEPRSVFAGYSATGQPRWREFAGLALEAGDPRTEKLFDERPVAFPVVQAGAELWRDQLPVYGKRSPIYHIIAQVALGYLDLRAGGEAGRSPTAVTLQAVEAAGDRSPAVLNTVGRLADGTPVYEALEETSDPRLLDALATTRRRLAEISVGRLPRRRRRAAKRRLVLDALHRLARNFDRIHRQQGRRTHHSRDRHRNRQRPASVAFRDALQASPDSIFRDVEQDTWVVLGPKNRVHVFNDDARHVTSIVYPGETVRHRTRKGKWRAPEEARAREFIAALEHHSRDGGEGEA